MHETFQKSQLYAEIIKVTDLDLVYGWGIVCTEKGEAYWDTQGDHIPEESMVTAVTDFMLDNREAKLMHRGVRVGDVVHSMPMTADLARAAYGAEVGDQMVARKTGWLVAVRFSDPTITAKYRSGELTGFSIGGFYVENEDPT